jgi:hypothetical protein
MAKTRIVKCKLYSTLCSKDSTAYNPEHIGREMFVIVRQLCGVDFWAEEGVDHVLYCLNEYVNDVTSGMGQQKQENTEYVFWRVFLRFSLTRSSSSVLCCVKLSTPACLSCLIQACAH